MRVHILFLVMTWVFPFCMKANMAIPYVAGTAHAAVYGNKNYSVTSEKIEIDIRKSEHEAHLYGLFKIHYKIDSRYHVNLPLLFLALGHNHTRSIKVNGRTIQEYTLDEGSISGFPFIIKLREEQEEAIYAAVYDNVDSVTVNLKDLIYFQAPLASGDNDIYIEYAVDFGYDTYGFLRNYKILYSLYPSKFWKSFGPIEVYLYGNGLAELTESNLGKAEMEHDTAHWTLYSIDENVDITVNHKTDPSGKILLLLQPFGIAVLVFAGLIFCHFRMLQKWATIRNWVLWLGIFIFPMLHFLVFLLSYDFIDWVLGSSSRHGYVFLYAMLYPIVVLFYGIFFFFWSKYKYPMHQK